MRWRICLEVILDNFEASNFFQTPKIETVVSKRGQIRSSICIFPLVSQSSNKYSVNFNTTYKWKKHRNCAWDSYPRLSTRIVSCATNQVQQATVFCFQNKKEHISSEPIPIHSIELKDSLTILKITRSRKKYYFKKLNNYRETFYAAFKGKCTF